MSLLYYRHMALTVYHPVGTCSMGMCMLVEQIACVHGAN